MTATNSAGTSPASDNSGAVTPMGVPAAPTLVSAEPRDTAAVLSWTAPAVTGGAEAIEYTATATNTANPADVKTCVSLDGATSCTVLGLTNTQTYTATVRARNPRVAGSSQESGPFGPVVPVPYADSGPGAAPEPPTAVTAIAGPQRAVVSWTRPASDGGRLITAYTVTAIGDPTKKCDTVGETSCVVTGLTQGQGYQFRVVAKNVIGNSPPGESAIVVPYGAYVPDLGPIAGDPPPADPDPWIGGQIVELTAAADVRLGGYGLWDKESSSYVNGGSVEDRAAYLFPMNQRLAAGTEAARALRSHAEPAAHAPGEQH